ncbi:MAG: glutaredoxin family protein [Spirulina sp. SIO3F2]|nr:glutaredoxin family protein [Spirulina sp. SIO3F2]
MHLILYSKPGCHLCEGLQEKLEQITDFPLELEVRDITTQPEWFDRYQYEIPVLFAVRNSSAIPIPRFSPRASVQQVARMLQKSCKI